MASGYYTLKGMANSRFEERKSKQFVMVVNRKLNELAATVEKCNVTLREKICFLQSHAFPANQQEINASKNSNSLNSTTGLWRGICLIQTISV